MSHARGLTWRLLILSLLLLPVLGAHAAGFEPVINMLGIASSTEIGEEIEWMVTFSNTGDSAGQNIVLSGEVGNGLAIENVQINTGTTSINGRTVTVSIPMLEPGATIQYTIVTRIVAAGDLSNTTCVTAATLSGEQCVRGLPVQALPETGETPYWREPALWLGVLIISVSSVMLGLGLLGFQSWQERDSLI